MGYLDFGGVGSMVVFGDVMGFGFVFGVGDLEGDVFVGEFEGGGGFDVGIGFCD